MINAKTVKNKSFQYRQGVISYTHVCGYQPYYENVYLDSQDLSNICFSYSLKQITYLSLGIIPYRKSLFLTQYMSFELDQCTYIWHLYAKVPGEYPWGSSTESFRLQGKQFHNMATFLGLKHLPCVTGAVWGKAKHVVKTKSTQHRLFRMTPTFFF